MTRILFIQRIVTIGPGRPGVVWRPELAAGQAVPHLAPLLAPGQRVAESVRTCTDCILTPVSQTDLSPLELCTTILFPPPRPLPSGGLSVARREARKLMYLQLNPQSKQGDGSYPMVSFKVSTLLSLFS